MLLADDLLRDDSMYAAASIDGLLLRCFILVQAVVVHCGGHPQCDTGYGHLLAAALPPSVGCMDAYTSGEGDAALACE